MKKTISLLAIISAMILSAYTPAHSEEAPEKLLVSAKMDSAVIWMGEQTSIKLDWFQAKGAPARWAAREDPRGEGVKIKTVTRGDTTEKKNGRIQFARKKIVTSFDPGFSYTPPIKYVLDTDTFASQPLSLKVAPVPVDTVSIDNLKAVKGVRSPRFVLWDYIPGYVWIIILGIAVILAGAYLYYRYFRNKDENNVQAEPQIPPYEKAIQALNMLKEEKLWQGGQDKQYYTRLTDILREYLDGRFSINAMEMTSTEILDALRRNNETRAVERHMKEILNVADFVKFAKMQPLADDNEASMRYAITFVEETKPQPEPVQDETSEKDAEKSGKTDKIK